MAKFAPSRGSVPEPSSSSKIKLLSVKVFKICTILVICEEKVLKDSSILCSSPISAKILSNIFMLLPSLAGINRPD